MFDLYGSGLGILIELCLVIDFMFESCRGCMGLMLLTESCLLSVLVCSACLGSKLGFDGSFEIVLGSISKFVEFLLGSSGSGHSLTVTKGLKM